MARILVIEDNASIAEIARRMLSDAGYELQIATTGGEAIQLWQNGGIDLVITDLHLPDTTGFAIVQRLRSIDPSVKVITMSGSSADPDAEGLRDLAAVRPIGFLRKPFARAQLLGLVAEQLGPG